MTYEFEAEIEFNFDFDYKEVYEAVVDAVLDDLKIGQYHLKSILHFQGQKHPCSPQ